MSKKGIHPHPKIHANKSPSSKMTFSRAHSKDILSAEDVRDLLSQTSLRNLLREEQKHSSDDLIRLLDNRDSKFTHDSSEESEEDSSVYEQSSTAEDEESDEDEEGINEDEEQDEDACEEHEEPENTASQESFKLPEEYEPNSQHQERIERYLTLCQDYKYLRKKNHFLQDKLYQLSVRKGIISTKEKHTESRSKKKRRIAHQTNTVGKFSGSQEDPGSSVVKSDKHETSSYSGSQASTATIFEGFRESRLSTKYEKVVHRIWQMERLREDIVERNNDRILEMKVKKDETDQECVLYFNETMNQIRRYSQEATNSNTGHHLPNIETDNYIDEMGKLFQKLRQTVRKFYLNWHGLNYEVKRLEEAELASQGEGLQIIEYEQLCGENETLRNKLDDRILELKKIKTKITNSVLVLAHFQEKRNVFMENIVSCQVSLDVLKSRILQITDVLDSITDRFVILKDEEKTLDRQSEVIDNATIMKDLTKTIQEVTDLRAESNKMKYQERFKTLEIQNIKEQITYIKDHVPELQLRKANDKSCWTLDDSNRSEKVKCVTPSRLELEKEFKKLRLLQLLELRTVEPWQETRRQLSLSGIYPPCFASHPVTTTPV
ncbi:unnamed protein product [Allacma fusca]|uniref:CCDC113/CCDC96 coiled-coil domain-containing protein n=1 Tax=Allacma fusca TaxID=39272 RepID=A0A8J2JIN6_9HEXA|nr:unnamed protein product [Allacma fusca]